MTEQEKLARADTIGRNAIALLEAIIYASPTPRAAFETIALIVDRYCHYAIFAEGKKFDDIREVYDMVKRRGSCHRHAAMIAQLSVCRDCGDGKCKES